MRYIWDIWGLRIVIEDGTVTLGLRAKGEVLAKIDVVEGGP
jgi:hypothetical protein